MNPIEKRLSNLNPRYLEEYEELIKRYSQFGGGATDDKYVLGRSFSNVYEFYIYAFFIGLYNNLPLDISDDDTLKSFWEIKNWQPKELVNVLIICAMAKSDFNMSEIETHGDKEISNELAKLRSVIESYANGGFKIITDKVASDPDHALQDDFFLTILGED